jgi:hypothetical protein
MEPVVLATPTTSLRALFTIHRLAVCTLCAVTLNSAAECASCTVMTGYCTALPLHWLLCETRVNVRRQTGGAAGHHMYMQGSVTSTSVRRAL